MWQEACRDYCPYGQLFAWCRPFAQRYAILLANGRGAYRPLDLDSMDQRQLAEAVRKILQAAGLDGWQVSLALSPCSDLPVRKRL